MEMMMIGARPSIAPREPWQASKKKRVKSEERRVKKSRFFTSLFTLPPFTLRSFSLLDRLQILFRFLSLIAVGRELDHFLEIGFCVFRFAALDRGQAAGIVAFRSSRTPC